MERKCSMHNISCIKISKKVVSMQGKFNFISAIFIIALIGAIVLPLIGVWLPKISATLNWLGYTVILVFCLNIQKGK